jgi:hypothetical protein
MSHPSWDDEQISILPSPGVDRSEFITAVFKERLYYIGAIVEGQSIDISTKGCAEIGIDLSADLVDLAQPVLIRCNGVKRHEGVIRPSIRTLLNRAYERWEFSRPVSAVITLSVRRDGVPP